MKTNIHFFVISRSIILELKMFQTKVVEELETQILCFRIFRKFVEKIQVSLKCG